MPDDRGLLLRDQPAQTSPQPIRPVRPCAPWGLTGHFGHSFGPSYLTIGKEYSDWSLGATVTVKNLVAGLQYVDTNKSLYSPRGRNIAGAGVVASLGVSF